MNWRLVLVAVFGTAMVVAIGVVAALVVAAFGQVTVSAKKNVAGNIVGGTLSIGALALAFLGYSLAQRREHFGTKPARIHSRVAMMMYFLIPLSLFDALTSTTYLLISSSGLHTTYSWLFELSLALLFVIGEGLIAATTYVIAEEFGY